LRKNPCLRTLYINIYHRYSAEVQPSESLQSWYTSCLPDLFISTLRRKRQSWSEIVLRLNSPRSLESLSAKVIIDTSSTVQRDPMLQGERILSAEHRADWLLLQHPLSSQRHRVPSSREKRASVDIAAMIKLIISRIIIASTLQESGLDNRLHLVVRVTERLT
jgi:hypothetical protein